MPHALWPEAATPEFGCEAIRDALSVRTETSRGQKRCLRLGPLESPSAARRQLQAVSELRDLRRQGLLLRLGPLNDIEAIAHQCKKGAVASGLELQLVAQAVRLGDELRRQARQHRLPALGASFDGLPGFGALASELDEALEPTGAVRDDASESLREARERVRALNRTLRSRLEDLVRDRELGEWLQDDYFTVRNGRFVLPVKASFQSQVAGIIHDSSQTDQTVFIEPHEIVGLGNELALAERAAHAAEQLVLRALSEAVMDRFDDLVMLAAVVEWYDVSVAAALLADDLRAEPVTFDDDFDGVSLVQARDPLLQLKGLDPVPNDFTLTGDQRGLLITGPNAGGKTVALRTVGMAVWMAQCGLPICAAAGSRLGPIVQVIAVVGDAQDVALGRSSFSGHLEYLKAALEACERHAPALVLVDEIAATTDPSEGSALAQAFVEHVLGHRAFLVVTTHLQELKAMALTDPRVLGAGIEINADTRRPSFRLARNALSGSNALDLARQVGLPGPVVTRARELLRGTDRLSLAMARLAESQQKLDEEEARIRREVHRLERDRKELAQLKEHLTQAALEHRHRETEEFAVQVAELRQSVLDEIQRLRQSPERVPEAQRLVQSLQKTRDALQGQSAPSKSSPTSNRPPVERGDKVHITSLNQSGEVIGSEGDVVVVAVGALRFRAARSDLVVTGRTETRAPTVRIVAEVTETLDHRLDVRGQKVDEALATTERFLDRSVREQVGQVWIQHGLGSLRQALHEFLRRSPYVESFREAERHEGGPTNTVVQLST